MTENSGADESAVPDPAEAFEGIDVAGASAAMVAARGHMKRLLQLRNITTVIHVDDDHPGSGEPALDPSEIIAALTDEVITIDFLARNEATSAIVTTETGELTTTQALAAKLELDPDGFAEAELVALTDAVRLINRSLAADAASAIDVATRPVDEAGTDRAITDRESTDLQSQAEIRGLIPNDVDYHPITLAEWLVQKNGRLASTQPVLILFDRDFRLEGEADDLGESLLAEAISQNNDNIYCGMLTHGAGSDAGERELVARIAERGGMSDDIVDIVVISKSTVVAEPEKLPTKLKGALLARHVRVLRSRILEIYADAGQIAAAEVKKLDAYTLSELIVAADTEGAHGVHNVLRVAATKQRIATHRALWPDQVINSSLRDIREIHDARREANPLPATDISPLRREDRYDTREYLAELHLPLEPGDIFEKVNPSVVLNNAKLASGGRRYILLMQACDIVVRGDGHRLGDPKTLTLALVKRIDRTDRHSFDHILDWYDDVDDGEVWCVRMSDRVQFPVRALEACVFSEVGDAVVKIGQEPPDTLTPGWRKRFDNLQTWGKTKLTAYKQMTASNSDVNVDRLLTESLTGTTAELVDVKAKFDSSGERIGFGLRRIGRASNDDARLILANAGNYTARPDREGDLFPAS